MRTSPLHVGYDLRRVIKRGEFFYSLTTAPTVEPVTLNEAKLFARVDTTEDDALITALIIAARQTVEKQTGRALIEQVWTATLDRLPQAGIFELAHRPIMSVTSIRAFNDDDTYEGLNVATDIILDGQNGRISLKSSAASIVGDRATSVYQIVYKAGYGATAASVPEWAKLSIKQIVAHWYEHRESVQAGNLEQVPFGARLLMDQNTVIEL
jgi:uncharacterized phiE125 gp8 family phage protein